MKKIGLRGEHQGRMSPRSARYDGLSENIFKSIRKQKI